MMKAFSKLLFSISFLFFANFTTIGQNTVTIPASTKYHKGKLYKSLFGEHYRKDWHTPATFSKVMIDTLEGGLTPYEMGGGRQSRSLKLRDKNNREYVLRSIDKTFGKALPEIAQGSFIESMANDQVTISHPYGALIVSPLAEAAGILHTNPRIFFVPKQTALGEFNDAIGDALYLFEQRPDEDWATAANFAYSKKIIGTDKLLEKLIEDNDNFVDQKLFVRSRLFDFFIGDWGRHEDNWRWAKTEEDDKNIYKPVPRDRDNAFTRLDGFLLGKILPSHLQTFATNIKDINTFGFTARGMDRRFTNELSFEDWIDIAKDLQAKITDEDIDNAVKQLPKEVYPISGPQIAALLKVRKSQIVFWATEYFDFVNKEVEIPGTKKREYFEVNRLSAEATEVKIYDFNNEGEVKKKPFYERIFSNNETKELRLYNVGGDDVFKINGEASTGIKIDIIGGDSKPTFGNNSSANGKAKTIKVWNADYRLDSSATNNRTFKFLNSENINGYEYKNFNYNKKGISPIIYYNQEDRIHVGLAYKLIKQKWSKKPFWQYHSFEGRYSIEQKAFSFTYDGALMQLLGKWNVGLYLNADQRRWLNFFGLGNENIKETDSINFNRLRSKEYLVQPSIFRVYNNKFKVSVSPYYKIIDPIFDAGRYAQKTFPYSASTNYEKRNFAGAQMNLIYQKVNDSSLATKGISILTGADYTKALKSSANDFTNLFAEVTGYVPLTKTIGIRTRVGGAHLLQNPSEFYLYNTIGGSKSLRGVQRDRFQGNTTFFNQNELRWIKDVRSYLYNGRFGIFALYDVGRVWLNDENSNTWHAGYGGGIILSPFNKINVALGYAKSKDDKNFVIQFINVLH